MSKNEVGTTDKIESREQIKRTDFNKLFGGIQKNFHPYA